MDTMQLLVLTKEPIMANLWQAAFDDDAVIEVVGTVTTPDEITGANYSYDAVLVCVLRHEDEGLQWVYEIRQSQAASKIAVVGIPLDKISLLKFVEAGATGFIPPDANVNEAREILLGIHHGEAILDEEVVPLLIDRLRSLRSSYSPPDTQGKKLELLTPRESEVLELIVRKMTNREIATELIIEVGTVKNHVHSILEKLEFDSRYEAATYYISHVKAGAYAAD